MDKIAVLDFGGQYTHLIANRIRRLGVYSQILSNTTAAADLKQHKGIILSGSPHSVLEPGSPTVDPAILSLGIPVLGLCYGHQLIARLLGGTVSRGKSREYGLAEMNLEEDRTLLRGLKPKEQIWMSHGDAVKELPEGFSVLGTTSDCQTAAVGNEQRRIYGLQFHPEVTDTPSGTVILDNFLNICQCDRQWNPQAYIEEIETSIRQTCGDRKVFLLVSGGVDSTVAFSLLNNTLGPDRVLGLHIDNGLMRLGESDDIGKYMREHGFENLHVVDATEDFLSALEGVSDPEEKRRIIGTTFLDVKVREEQHLGLNADDWLLGQGTIYPDTIESAGTEHADRIKTHHNRVDLVLELLAKGLVIEPLAQLYKDEVRELGAVLDLPHSLLWRHPFPGPGLGVRTLCSDGQEQTVSESVKEQVSSRARQAGFQAAVLPVRSVGVQGDGRTYAHPALVTGPRDWVALERLSTAMTNGVAEINRVVYGLDLDTIPRYRVIPAYVTHDRLDKLRAIDNVVTEALMASGEYATVWQMPVVLLPLVNEAGEECVVLRPIMSQEAMTVRFAPLKAETLEVIAAAARSIDGIGDLFFDITHKPPGTIEWE